MRSWDELRQHLPLGGRVVGWMCARIFGYDDEAALERADTLRRAPAINILRDVREDAARAGLSLRGRGG